MTIMLDPGLWAHVMFSCAKSRELRKVTQDHSDFLTIFNTEYTVQIAKIEISEREFDSTKQEKLTTKLFFRVLIGEFGNSIGC